MTPVLPEDQEEGKKPLFVPQKSRWFSSMLQAYLSDPEEWMFQSLAIIYAVLKNPKEFLTWEPPGIFLLLENFTFFSQHFAVDCSGLKQCWTAVLLSDTWKAILPSAYICNPH